MIEDDEPEEVPETRIDVEIPKIGTDLGKHIHFVKLPNFLSVETRCVTRQDKVLQQLADTRVPGSKTTC